MQPPAGRFDSEWRARFERFGSTYTDEASISGWSVDGLSRRVRLLEAIVREVPTAPGGLALELGCGPGTHVRFLAERGQTAVGLDYSLPTLRRAVHADPDGKGHYVAGEGYRLPFAPAAFDLVLCLGVLQAVGTPERVLDEIARVVRPGGVVVIEALNACAAPAVFRGLVELASGRPRRLQAFRSGQIVSWLAQRELALVRRVAVYLPPRQFPGLGRFLDRPGCAAVLDGTPGLQGLAAHAFWFVGRKR